MFNAQSASQAFLAALGAPLPAEDPICPECFPPLDGEMTWQDVLSAATRFSECSVGEGEWYVGMFVRLEDESLMWIRDAMRA